MHWPIESILKIILMMRTELKRTKGGYGRVGLLSHGNGEELGPIRGNMKNNLSINEILKTFFGYDNFRVGQEEIINHLLEKKKTFL